MPIKTLDEYLEQATTKQQTTASEYRIVEFYKETSFQETPIGKIPKGWGIRRINNLFNLSLIHI